MKAADRITECAYCRKEFKKKSRGQIFCSDECKELIDSNVCYVCGEPIPEDKKIHRKCMKKIDFKVYEEFIYDE